MLTKRECLVQFTSNLVLLTFRGVQKLTGKNLKVVWGQVFHFKLDSFAVIKEVHGAKARPCLKLKTRPRFYPASLSLSMDYLTKQDTLIRRSIVPIIPFWLVFPDSTSKLGLNKRVEQRNNLAKPDILKL
jgi:hypothetical protein